MKLSAFAVIFAAAALTQVSAAPAPIRLLIVSSHVEDDSPINGLRFGHAVRPIPYLDSDGNRELLPSPPAEDSPDAPSVHPVPPINSRLRPGCHGKKSKVGIFMHKIKIKAIKIGNCFRKALGWPLIQVKHHRHPHHHHHGPHHGHDGKKDDNIRVDGGFISILPFPGVDADNRWIANGPIDDNNHSRKDKPFLSRLHHSLMNLGQWEGRAVAFVIGCGIGVLVRMFWVLAIVTYRAFRGHRDDGYVAFAVMEEYESDDETVIAPPKADPPKYIYPVDEKVAAEE